MVRNHLREYDSPLTVYRGCWWAFKSILNIQIQRYEEGVTPIRMHSGQLKDKEGVRTWRSESGARRVALHSAVASGQSKAHQKCRPAAKQRNSP